MGRPQGVPAVSEAGAWPRITIVTPSLNQAAFIEDTIRSVLDQDYANLEYIIVDGGSLDGTAEIIKRYEHDLTYWVSERDRGQSHAINKGMERATGEVCGWLCGDDVLTPGALHTVGGFLREHPHCRWLAGSGEFHVLSTGSVTLRTAGLASPTALLEFWRHGESGHYLPQPSTFWRRSLWDESCGLREDNHLAMDYELWLKFQERTELHVMDRILSVSKLHPDCKTMHHRREQVREMMRCAYVGAARRGIGQWRLTRGLLAWAWRRQLGKGRRQLRARCWPGAIRELKRLVREAVTVWHEEGRLDVFNLP